MWASKVSENPLKNIANSDRLQQNIGHSKRLCQTMTETPETMKDSDSLEKTLDSFDCLSAIKTQKTFND